MREINRNSTEEINLVAERMRLTLVDVLGGDVGSTYYSKEWLIDRVKWHLSLGENALICLYEDGAKSIIGQAIVRLESDNQVHHREFAYFSTIFVVPEWRRKGIAIQLIKEVHKWCQFKELDKIIYNTAKDNNGLISLFNSFGYKIDLKSDDMVRLSLDI